MKVSYNQLKKYISKLPEVNQLARILTDIGLEVGGIESYESIPGSLNGLVIGEVKSCEKHPDADKLSLTSVDIGADDPLPIVCGAPNVTKGQKVVVATVGTTLYPDGKDFKIKKAKIRGQVSKGMICAEDEIGVGNSHEGIIVLPEDTPVGMSATEYYKPAVDYIIEIDLTPNRNDAVSHYGVARDLYAYLKYHGQNVQLIKPDISDFKTDDNSRTIPVEIENTDACKRYTALTITDVQVAESPDWLKNFLESLGLQSINNVVDITNFVLHELGHPLHAFDADQIKGDKVIVKTLPPASKFITLDEIERELSPDDLMICNTEEPMCIAGVFGGIKSGVNENTRNIFLESAYFDPVYVRKTAKKHALQTDASFRFERGADPDITAFAIKRAALLIKELAGGKISSEIFDIYPEKIKPHSVSLRYKQINRLTGKKIPAKDVKQILKALDIHISDENRESLKLKVPPYRADVTREADVIEEILRIYGYNNVEIPERVQSTLSYAPKPDAYKLQERVSEFLSAQGFAEAMSNSLTKAEYYKNDVFDDSETVTILNPLSADLNAMRQSMIHNALEAVNRNFNFKKSSVLLYEFGHIYKNSDNRNNYIKGYKEDARLILCMAGLRSPHNWLSPEKTSDFFLLKSKVNQIFSLLNFDIENFRTQETESPIFGYGLEYLTGGTVIARFGAVSNKLKAGFDIEQDVFFADIFWNKILNRYDNKITYRPIAKYPKVRRDLALLLDDKIKFSQIRDAAFKTEKKLLKDVSVFDVFKSEKLGENKKSYALSFILSDENKTLTDKRINKAMDKLIKTFEKEFDAELR